MSKQSVKRTSISKRLKTLNRTSVLVAVACLLVAGSVPVVRAVTLQQQIDSLNAQSSKKQQKVSDLQLQASSYQDAITKLQQQISAIEGAINVNLDKQAQLKQKIADYQTQIDYQRKVLGDDLRTMYVDGQMSTIEMLATSKNLSDYMDKEAYRQAVQDKVQTTLEQITTLQNQLQAKKTQVEQMLSVQKGQQAQLDSDKSQKDNLLAMNGSQQNEFNNQIKANQHKVTQLEAEQAAINAASTRAVNVVAPSGGSGGACDVGYGNGGYPMGLCNATQDSINGPGGFPNRECTSFAYWYFTSMEGNSLSVYGNAKDWVNTANRPVDHTPTKGSIFVKTEGPYGHTGIVVALPGQTFGGQTVPSGWVLTMSMNYDYAGHFHYSEYPIGNLYYIH